MAAELPVLVTIARQLGSGGSYLGQQVAKTLNYGYVDRQILKQAAKGLGCAEADLAHREERVQGFWSRLFGIFTVGPPERVYCPPPLDVIPDEELFAMERRILLRLAGEGSCVVVGHGGFHLLRGKGRLVNVFVHAPRAFRADRVMQFFGAGSREEAERMIDHSDRERERYILERTGGSWYDARNYHLAIDTARVDFPEAERLIVSMVRRVEEHPSSAPIPAAPEDKTPAG